MKVPVHNDFIWHYAGSVFLKVHANIVLIVRIISRNNEHLFQIGELSLEKKYLRVLGAWEYQMRDGGSVMKAIHVYLLCICFLTQLNPIGTSCLIRNSYSHIDSNNMHKSYFC